MTFREFTGKNVEEAIRAAMAEFSADLGDLDIEILAQGSRGVLGVGAEEARILAAPKSAVAAAESVRVETPAPSRAPAPAAEAPAVEPTESGEPTDSIGVEPSAAADEGGPVDLEVVAANADA
jgi:predicted RNA-binding protein Jag